jgi:alkylmercury lyase
MGARKEAVDMTETTITTLDTLWGAAARHLPELSPREQEAGLVLLAELAGGEPVGASHLAQALGTSAGAAKSLLRESRLGPFVHADEAGDALGFLGLSTVRTHHRFALDGPPLWTWCALDSLFLPELLGETARVESRDPASGEPVRLTVSPAGIESVEPTSVVLSMRSPEAWEISSAARVMATACHFIFFFASRTSGERWAAKHPQTGVLSLEEALAYGKRQNALLLGQALAQRTVAAARTPRAESHESRS